MTTNPEASVIADIDALVDEQLQQEASGYDHNINQDRCELCDGDWHGLPADVEYASGTTHPRRIGCPGAFATDEQRAAWRRDHPAHIDESHNWTAERLEGLRADYDRGRRQAVARADAAVGHVYIPIRVERMEVDGFQPAGDIENDDWMSARPSWGNPSREAGARAAFAESVTGRQLNDRQRAWLNQWGEAEPLPHVTVRGVPVPDRSMVLIDVEWTDTHSQRGPARCGARIAVSYELMAAPRRVTPIGPVPISGGWDVEIRAGGGDGVVTRSVTAALLSPRRALYPRVVAKLPIQWDVAEERCSCGARGPHLREQCEERHRARRARRRGHRAESRDGARTWRIDD